tara:strand:- start:1405 stop:2247 length:843 start_codon:yes stop_codon:yes gene_type:complete
MTIKILFGIQLERDFMKSYLQLLEYVLEKGVEKNDRTGVGTKSVFGWQMRYDLQEGFPLLTTKKLHWKSIVHELLWFLKGETNIKYLRENNIKIWDAWADENGDLGPVYGKQWRYWENKKENQTIDQIEEAINLIINNPNSRRIIVTAWNPADTSQMALPPCHCLFQFNVSNGKLSCQLYQRSADIFLGVPFNIASYSLLTHMVAKITNLEVGDFIHTLGDAHIYLNHIEQAKLQINRQTKKLPRLVIRKLHRNIQDYKFEDIELINYQSHPNIPAPIAV